jgi:AcrR family transcriptional regulator
VSYGQSSSEQEPAVDPLRTVRLLWEGAPAPARGRRPSLALEEIVAAGVRVADRKGIDALSMRQVAAELEVGTMSLYTYIATKAELVELMVDHVSSELLGCDTGQALSRERTRELALARWGLYHRHPWILQTNLLRFSLGPNVMDAAEALYAALEGWGMEPTRIHAAGQLIESFVQGAARVAIIDRETEELTRESFEDYFGNRMGFWEKYFDAERYPVQTRIWRSGGFDLRENPFHFGLERILDALELQITASQLRGSETLKETDGRIG